MSASKKLLLACGILLLAVPALVHLSAGAAPDSDSPAATEAPKKTRPKINVTRYEEFFLRDHINFTRAWGDDDRRPSYALLHAYLPCSTNFTEAKNLVINMLRHEYWPNVYFKNGQDAMPTLYIFTEAKKYAHRIDVMDKTEKEIKELLNSYGFYGTPFPEVPEEEDDSTSGKKTEL